MIGRVVDTDGQAKSKLYASSNSLRWEVMWVTLKKGKRIVVIEFDHDFAGARALYVKLLKARKPMATLRCTNVGFPPPEKIKDRMDAYNRRGAYWCPYCCELRKFEKRDGYESPLSEAWIDFKHMACPMCDIAHTDWYVTRYNPQFMLLQYRKKTRGRSSKSGRGRRRR